MVMGFKVFLIFFPAFLCGGNVTLGIDTFLAKENSKNYHNKRIGLISNHTAVSKEGKLTIDRLLDESSLSIKAIFAPEHGFFGNIEAGKTIDHTLYNGSIPIYSLYGETRRPTKEMLKEIDVLVFDIQDIGIRPYTYTSTLFYCMEEAAKFNIEMVVLDRPNPMGNCPFDGPMLEESFRSFVGYINVPYCHSLTICELALLFNREYKIGCNLKCFLMEGWEDRAVFKETDLLWIPTSPNIPEPDTPFYCATTGAIGELGCVSIGIGTAYPFKVVAAPWIDAKKFSDTLNNQKLPGVIFTPCFFTPFSGAMKNTLCKGVKIHITETSSYKPIKTGLMLLGLLKSLYPKEMNKHLASLKISNKEMYNKVNGSEKYFSILSKESFPAYSLIEASEKDHRFFEEIRKKYLFYCSKPH
jgi:uncharacterized protein YbbC (DUF1343 family)